MRCIAIFSIILVLYYFVPNVAAIDCYQCSTRDNKYCEKSFKKTHFGMCPNAHSCFVATFDYGHRGHLIRGCGDFYTSPDYYRLSNDIHFKLIKQSQCAYNVCNSSNGMKMSRYGLVTGLIVSALWSIYKF